MTFQFWKLHHCHSRVQMKRHCWFIYQNKLRDSRRSCEAHTREDGNRNKGCTKSSHSKWIELKEHLVIDTNVSCKVTSAHIWEGLDSNKWGEFRHWRNMQHKYKSKWNTNTNTNTCSTNIINTNKIIFILQKTDQKKTQIQINMRYPKNMWVPTFECVWVYVFQELGYTWSTLSLISNFSCHQSCYPSNRNYSFSLIFWVVEQGSWCTSFNKSFKQWTPWFVIGNINRKVLLLLKTYCILSYLTFCQLPPLAPNQK